MEYSSEITVLNCYKYFCYQPCYLEICPSIFWKYVHQFYQVSGSKQTPVCDRPVAPPLGQSGPVLLNTGRSTSKRIFGVLQFYCLLISCRLVKWMDYSTRTLAYLWLKAGYRIKYFLNTGVPYMHPNSLDSVQEMKTVLQTPDKLCDQTVCNFLIKST